MDLRECVVRNIEHGMKWDDACRIFLVSRDSIHRWLKKKQSGSLADPPRKEYKAKKIDKSLLLAELEKTPDATLEELAQKFHCVSNLFTHAAKYSAFPVKKTVLYVERDEEKRHTFQAALAKLLPADVVYLDETGIDASFAQFNNRKSSYVM